MSNYNIYVDLTSSNPLKFSQNRGNSERLSDSAPNNQNKALLSRIAGDFGNLSQDKLNFAAHISLYPVQKSDFSGGVA